MKTHLTILCVILLILGGGLYWTLAAPQNNDLSEEQVLNKAYNATDGALQIDLVNDSRSLTPQNNALSPGQIWNFAYNATDGAIQVSCDNCGGGGGNDFAEYVNITGIAPHLDLLNTTPEDTDAGRESILNWKGTQSGSEQTTLGQLRFDHYGSGDDELGRFSLNVNKGGEGDNPSTLLTAAHDAVVLQALTDSTDFFQIQDAASDSIITIDSTNERFGLGITAPESIVHFTDAGGTSPRDIYFESNQWATSGMRLYFRKSNGSFASKTNTTIDNLLGEIRFDGYHSGGYYTAARITAEIDDNPGTADMPGRLIFGVSADGSASITERMRLDNNGFLGIGTTGADRKLDVLDNTNPQMRLTHTDGSVYTDFQTDSNGDLLITPSDDRVQITGDLHLIGDVFGGEEILLTNDSNLGNIARLRAYPGSATNVGTLLDLIPKGTGAIIGQSAMNLYGTDAIADSANIEVFTMRASGTEYAFYADKSGSGAQRPVRIAASGFAANDLYIDTDGEVGIGTNAPSTELHISGDMRQTVHTDDVSTPPTDAELDAIFGTPATVGAGFSVYLNDDGAGNNFYHIVSDGTNWWIFTPAKAS